MKLKNIKFKIKNLKLYTTKKNTFFKVLEI